MLGSTWHFLGDTKNVCQFFKILYIYIYIYIYCRVTICSPNPDELGYKPNEPNTINLQRVGERTELLADWLTVSSDSKCIRAGN